MLNLMRLTDGVPVVFFFFSSRRRHTRCLSDWSSDVCSSDLQLAELLAELADVEPDLAEVNVEEGYAYWTGLPGKIRLDVGKFRQQFGELNRWHLHAVPET